MEKTKHTPGPWTLGTRAAYQNRDDPVFWHRDVVNGSKTIRVAKVSGVGEDRAEANACLIAAAPDLLEAAKVLISSLVWERKRSGITYAGGEMLEAAIVKAEGRE